MNPWRFARRRLICMFASVLGGLLDVLVAVYVGSPLELNLCDVGQH